ncbi:MAG: heme-binding protein [Pseudomonadota bacterium]|nr:heme-binding protein [Pseudomonadota bacterium]
MTIPSFSPSRVLLSAAVTAMCAVAGQAAWAAPTNPANDCVGLPSSSILEAALKAVVSSTAGGTGATNGGLDFPMWATVVNRYGVVCAVATSASVADDAWLNSRAISAQKASTANGFSRPKHALSTANLFSPTQNGNSLNGLQFSNPVDPRVVYRGDPTKYGTPTDPMIGLKPGGINVFGGGLGLYSAGGKLGAVGVSGDTSCADHNIAWKLRNRLAIGGYSGVKVANRVPGGVRSAQVGTSNQPVAPDGDDGIMYGNTGYQHADCGNGEKNIVLPAVVN